MRIHPSLCAAIALVGCSEAMDSETALRQHGYSETYVSGYHDGCESGKKAGGMFTHKRVRNETAYSQGHDYTTGWDYGFLTCKQHAERELAAAAAVGAVLVVGATAHGADGVNARDALKGVDTSAIRAAGW